MSLDHSLPTIWAPKRHRTARVSPPPFPGLRQRGNPAHLHPRLAGLVTSAVLEN